MTTIVLSPLVDRAGTVLHDNAGIPLAADGDGLVYTMTRDAGPRPLGELAEDGQGRVILVPLGSLGAIDPEDKGQKLTRLGRKRAHLRGRIAHHEGRLRRLREAGAQSTDKRLDKHTGRLESLNAELAQVQAALEAANAEALNGLGDDGSDSDDMQGLGAFRDFWNNNKKLIGGIGIGAAGAALVGSAMNPNSGLGKGVRALPGALKDFFVGDGGAAAGAGGGGDAGAGAPMAMAASAAPLVPSAAVPATAAAIPVAAVPMTPADYASFQPARGRGGGAGGFSLGSVPTWAWIAGAAAVGLLLLKRRSA